MRLVTYARDKEVRLYLGDTADVLDWSTDTVCADDGPPLYAIASPVTCLLRRLIYANQAHIALG